MFLNGFNLIGCMMSEVDLNMQVKSLIRFLPSGYEVRFYLITTATETLTSPGWSGTGPASCSSPVRCWCWCCCWSGSAAGTAGWRWCCCLSRRGGPASWWGTALQPLSSSQAAGRLTPGRRSAERTAEKFVC